MKNLKRIILSLLAVMCVCPALLARTLSPSEALRIASNFQNGHAGTMSAGGARNASLQLAHTATPAQSSVPAYYVFNRNESDGFIIISADDRLPGVLGYTDSGTYTAGKMPENVQWWLNEYERQIEYYLHSGATNSTATAQSVSSRSDYPIIQPLIKTQWNQLTPYNDLCPEYQGERCVTGCVATAMAQIMKYHNYPAQGKGSHSYTTTSSNIDVSFDYAATTFDWDNMANIYDGNTTAAQNKAVATLMLACGVSVNMNYTPTESGTAIHHTAYALQKYFGYSKNVDYDIRDGYTDDEWEQLVYSELANSRPVLYSGRDYRIGHAFVCDGYNGNGLFHINWGWGGLYDGYFLLDALNPIGTGIGGGSGCYNSDQGIVMGIEPSDGGETVGQNFTLFSEGSFNCFGNNTFNLDGDVFIIYTGKYSIPLGIFIVPEDKPDIEHFFQSTLTLEFDTRPDDYPYYPSVTFTAEPTGLQPGKYIVYPAYICPDGTRKRLRCPITENTHVNLTVKEDGSLDYGVELSPAKLVVTEISLPEEIFVGETVNILISVENTGTETYAGIMNIHIRKKGDDTDVQSFGNILPLPPLAKRTVKKEYNCELEPGEYEIVITDDSGNIANSEPVFFTVEDNNIMKLSANSFSLENLYGGEFADPVINFTNTSSREVTAELILNFYRKGSSVKSFSLFTPEITVAANTTIDYTWYFFKIDKDTTPGIYEIAVCDKNGNELNKHFEVKLFQQDNGLWFTVDENQKAIIGKSPKEAYSGALLLPEVLTFDANTYPVIAITGDAFEGCTELSSLFCAAATLQLDNAETVFASVPETAEIYVCYDVYSRYSSVLPALKHKIYSIIESVDVTINEPVHSGKQFTATLKPKPENIWFNPEFKITVPESNIIQYVSLSPINKDGTITATFVAKETGEGTISFQSAQPGLKAVEAQVVIEENVIEASGISISETSISLVEEESFTLEASIEPKGAEGTITWSTSDEAIAAVDENGTVTAIAAGTATITAACGELTAICEVTVNPKVVKPIGIKLNSSQITLTEGASFLLEATITPEGAEGEILWESTDTRVATVDSQGKVTAVGEGDVTIRAICGECSADCIVTVERKIIQPAGILLNTPQIILQEGTSFLLEAKLLPEGAEEAIIWSSSDEAVATVDENGTVTAVAQGTATITASCGELTATCEVTVEKRIVKPAGIYLNTSQITLIKGTSFTLEATIIPEEAEAIITWNSSDETVATVDHTGTVTAVAQGTATITASCGELSAQCEVTVETKKPTGITINTTQISLSEGTLFHLTATLVPVDAEGTITWSTSDEAIAKVDETGRGEAVSQGTATITASCGELSAQCEITVTKKIVEPTELVLNSSQITLTEGTAYQLEATIIPEEAEGNIIWATSDNIIAGVSENGIVTAIAPGTATITASCGELTASCEVTVEKKIIKPTGVTLNPKQATIKEGESFRITATIIPEEAEGVITWSTSNAVVATVDDNGNVMGCSPGTATITASCGDFTAICEVTVLKATIDVSQLVLNLEKAELIENNTLQLIATISPDNATDKTITWTSSDAEVAAVDTHGLVSALKKGTATITATASNGLNTTCTITVVAETIEPVALTLNLEESELIENNTLQLIATISPDNATDKTITWTSSDAEVAAVDTHGLISALKKGTATITATASNGLNATCTITVVAETIEPVALTLNLEEAELIESNTLQLIATISPDNVTDKTITWTSSDAEVATVDTHGLVSALKKGMATITATASNGMTAHCIITVVEKPSGIGSIDGDKKDSVRVENGDIVIDGEVKAEIFNISGVRVAVSNGGIVSGLPRGIYIVRVGGRSFKIVK